MTKTIDRGPDAPPNINDREPRLHLPYVSKTKQAFLRYASKFDVPPETIAIRALRIHNIRDELNENEVLAIRKSHRRKVELINHPYRQESIRKPVAPTTVVYDFSSLDPLILTFTGEPRLNLLNLADRYSTTPTTIGRNALALFQTCDELDPREKLIVFNEESREVIERIDLWEVASLGDGYHQ